jgi:hypothetical protein
MFLTVAISYPAQEGKNRAGCEEYGRLFLREEKKADPSQENRGSLLKLFNDMGDNGRT